MINTDSAREQMVDQQVRTWDVFDEAVLAVIGSVPRERYVPTRFRDCAYADAEVQLDHGQCMLRPSLCGRILQSLDIDSKDEILEIGTGTGYLTHCLASLGARVTSVELFQDFVETAKRNLKASAIHNVQVDCLDASSSLPPGTFDVIAVTCAVDGDIDRFVEALSPGGRLFVVDGESPAMQAVLVTRTESGDIEQSELFETDIPAMVTAAKPPVFSF